MNIDRNGKSAVNYCLSQGDTNPGIRFGNGFTRVPEQEVGR